MICQSVLRNLLFLSFMLITNFASAQLLQWNTFGNTGSESTEPSVANDTRISSASLTKGSGVTNATNSNRFGGSNWFDTGDSNPTTLSESITGNDYIQFTVTPTSGSQFSVTSLVFSWDRSNTGPSSVALRYSIDGYSSDLGSVTSLPASLSTGNTISISGITDIISSVTFRLYGYNATGATGTGGFDCTTNAVNVVLNGSASAIPPSIAISSAHPAAPSNFALNSNNNIVAGIQLGVTSANATLTGISFTTNGNYQTSDIKSNGFKLWLSSSSTSVSGATQLGTPAVVGTGGTVSLSGLTSTINSGTTRFILFTADIAATAVNGHTIGVDATAFSNITFSSGTKTGTDPVAASNASSLPIKLISFSATRQNNQAQLTFATATEENNNFFAIERSGNGTDFRTIGKVNGAGTTTSIQNYTFMDETPLSGINYYRLKQVDFDGQFSYSPVVNVVFDNKAGIRLAPTPVQDQLRVELDEMFLDDAQWQLYDFAGRLVQTGVLSAENTLFNVEVGSLTPGNYVIRVVSGQTTLTKQFQK